MVRLRRIFILCCALFALGPLSSQAQVATFEPASGVLKIPSVQVGSSIYVNVTLQDIGGLVFDLQSATLESPSATPPFASYDVLAEVLTIPTVNAGATNYVAVTLKNSGNFRFTVLGATAQAAEPTVTAPARRLEVWSSLDVNTGSGSYSLAVVDPAAPGALAAVDTLPVADGSVLRIRGGSFDPATGRVVDPGIRQLVYVKGRRVFRVSLDQDAAPSAPVQVSSDANVVGLPLLVAQSATGDDALLQISTGGFVRLSSSVAGAALRPPTFPGDASAGFFVSWGVDPSTGAINELLWYGLMANGSFRLFRTGLDFQGASSIAVFKDVVDRVGLELFQRSARGFFFRADGAIRRYDFADRSLRVVQDGILGRIGGGVFDDESLALRVQTAGGPKLLRCVDALGANCVTLATGDILLASKAPSLRQSRDHLLLASADNTTMLTVRKSDGAQASLAVPDGLIRSWWSPGFGVADGQRILYFRLDATGRPYTGSFDANGGDRKEFLAQVLNPSAAPAQVAASRLGGLGWELPFDRVLVRPGVAGNANTGFDRLAWLSAVTGDLGPDIGSVPSKYLVAPVLIGAARPYSFVLARQGTIGLLADVRQPSGALTPRLDAFLVGDQANSLLRLTTNIP